MTESLRCPECRGALTRGPAGLRCDACHNEFESSDGIWDLRQGARDRALSPALAELTSGPGRPRSAEQWPRAIRRLTQGREAERDLLDALIADRLCAWKLFLGLSQDAVALVIGAGYGAAVSSLAPHLGRLYVLDPDWAHLALCRLRLALFNPADDVILLAGDGGPSLPFAEGLFDCIVVTRHLDGLPADPTGPEDFAELRRILKPSGELLVAAPGGRLAGRVPGGPKARLKQAGFAPPEVFLLPRGPLRSDQILAPDMTLAHWRPARARRPFGLVTGAATDRPVHGLIARPGGPAAPRLLESILDQIERDLTAPLGAGGLQIERLLVTRKDKVILTGRQGSTGIIARITLNDPARAGEATNAELLAALQDRPATAELCPKPLAQGRCQQLDYFVESQMPGRELAGLLEAEGRTARLAEVAALLQAVNPAPARQPFDGPWYDAQVSEALARVDAVLDDAGTAKALARFFEARLKGASLPMGFCHGDFGLTNILVQDHRVSGLIDWENGSREGIPLLDPINYLLSAHLRFESRFQPFQRIQLLADDHWPNDAERVFLDQLYTAAGVDPGLHEALVYLFWLRAANFRLSGADRFSNRKIGNYIAPVVSGILSREPA